MKGKLLKKLNDISPEWIKLLGNKIIRAKVIKNTTFKNTINEIKNFEFKSEEEKEKIHFEKVKDIIIYAYENTDYYKKIFDDIGIHQ